MKTADTRLGFLAATQLFYHLAKLRYLFGATMAIALITLIRVC
ncbi:hypothetical protein [Cuspidothrix issatschenkoi]|nr:hypothetical protein [Cuspidothrix issatschenkoi]